MPSVIQPSTALRRIQVVENKKYIPIVPESRVVLSSALSGRGVMVEKFLTPEGIVYPLRQPIAHLVFLCTTACVRVEGRLDAKPHATFSGLGDIWILPRGVDMSDHWHGPHGGIMISIPEIVFAQQIEGLVDGGRMELIPTNNLADHQLVRLIHALVGEIEEPQNQDTLLEEMLVNTICIKLGRLCATHSVGSSQSKGGMPPARLRRVQDFIEAHLADQIEVDDLARIAEMGVFHFSRLFKRSMGVSPWRYVRQQRIALAKRILKDSVIKTSDVGLYVGFEHRTNFTRAFHEETGMSPRHFRNLYS